MGTNQFSRLLILLVLQEQRCYLQLSDNDTNDIPVIDDSKRTAKKARKQYKKELKIAEFAKYYFAHLNEEQICSILRIDRSTYYRYLQQLAAQQEKKYDEFYNDSFKVEVASFDNTMRKALIKMQEILGSKDSEPLEKVEAANLMCEIAKYKLKLYDPRYGVIATMRSLPIVVKKVVNELEEEENRNALPERKTKKRKADVSA